MNMIEKVDLTKAYYLQHLITEHYQECMNVCGQQHTINVWFYSFSDNMGDGFLLLCF